MANKRIFPRAACLALCAALLAGCAQAAQAPQTQPATESAQTTLPTEPAPTAPPDGDPGDVTCKGSYYGDVTPGVQVAAAGEHILTAGLLNAFYSLEAGSYRASGSDLQPDWDQGLDTQLCTLPGSEELTWQQHFLRLALNRWHSCAALVEASASAAMPLDPEYAPYQKTHDTFLREDLPMIKDLYGWDPSYRINELHQAFIDSLPQLLEDLGGAGEDLLEAATLLNQAYGYSQFELFHRGPTQEECDALAATLAPEEKTVAFCHILLTGADAARQAQELLGWSQEGDRYDFSVLANTWSRDTGTQASGGVYQNITQGQMAEELDSWLFDAGREMDDLAVVESSLGTHVVWFLGFDDAASLAQAQLRTQKRLALVEQAREALPITVTYSAITLGREERDLTWEMLLYPDIRHENLVRPPVYLQQDYPHADYGRANLASSGCGITTMAMMVSYMADRFVTPPVLADQYPTYYTSNGGTDTKLLVDAATDYGFFVYDTSYDFRDAKPWMEQGLMVLNLQHKGHFTSGGHYLLLRDLNEDGSVAICDSNIYNYGDVPEHRDNRFGWFTIGNAGVYYVAYQPKITHVDACARCGDDPAPEGLLLAEYLCPKCREALERRADFLAMTGNP